MKVYEFITINEEYEVVESIIFTDKEKAFEVMKLRYNNELEAVKSDNIDVIEEEITEDSAHIYWEEDGEVSVYVMHIIEEDLEV